MFKAVLQVYKKAYDEQCQAELRTPDQNRNAQSSVFQCPVSTTAFRESEFWRTFQHVGSDPDSSTSAGDNEIDAIDWSFLNAWSCDMDSWIGDGSTQ